MSTQGYIAKARSSDSPVEVEGALASRKSTSWSAQLRIRLAGAIRPLPYFRGRYRIMNALLPANVWQRASVFGAPMDLDLSDYMQRNIFIGSYEMEEIKWVKSLLRQGMTFVDIGANVGFYSALACSLVGTTGRVLAFEPNPTVFRQLRSWMGAGEFPQVKLLPIALDCEPGELTLHIPPHSEHNNNANAISGSADWRSETVAARTLDSFLEEAGISRVDLLKIDVEGLEPRVFAGAERSIRAGKIRAILSEFHPVHLGLTGWSPDRLTTWLTDRGFVLKRATDTNRLLTYNRAPN